MRDVLGSGLAGPGSDSSEVSIVGIGSAALDLRVAPVCVLPAHLKSFGVGEHLPVDDIRQAAFEGARRGDRQDACQMRATPNCGG
jgi:hypothetical protein